MTDDCVTLFKLTFLATAVLNGWSKATSVANSFSYILNRSDPVALIVDYYDNVRDHYGDDRELKAEPQSVALIIAIAYPAKLLGPRDLRSRATANPQCH
jgi:hypothetical protein